jgi:hypothetical protein
MGQRTLPSGQLIRGQWLEEKSVGQRTEHALEAAGNARPARGGRGEGHEAGERLPGASDGDFLAGGGAGEEARELGLGVVDVDDRGGGFRRALRGGARNARGGL